MKRIILSFMALIFAVSSFAQSTVETINSPKAMKPIIMVIPEKAWCINQGFVKDNDPKSPDYEKALLNDDVLNVITKWAASCKNAVILSRTCRVLWMN